MDATANKPKKRCRRVFGKIIREVDGDDVEFKMTPFGLAVRVKFSRKPATILPFSEIYDHARGQKKLL